ncbi:MAG: hypothetical protein K5754_01485 [Butyrivibrio sp.]|nr:hypothetical protein [Butyrivibrio sp.]MCR4634876.1 hypothetical protein [Butyrivibrio sp.]
MQVNINIKQLSKRGRRIKPVPFDYEESFDTAEDFIKATVKIMYKAFMDKESGIIESEDGVFNDGRSDDQRLESNQEFKSKVLSSEEIGTMAEAGKIAFGLIYGDKNVTLDKAVETALLAYKDGLVRLFIGDEEAGNLESKISLKDGDSVTFIRLTFLAGRMW